MNKRGGIRNFIEGETPGLKTATPDEIAQARALYQTNDLEIDNDAQTSHTKSGHWISAWLWIPRGVADKPRESREKKSYDM